MMLMSFLEVEASGLTGEVRINDVPAATFGPTGFRAYVPAMTHLTHGSNWMTARWRVTGKEPRLLARLAQFVDGEEFFVGAGRELARLDRAQPDAPRDVAFFNTTGPLTWSWRLCRSWSSPAEALMAARPFVAALLTAFHTGDSAWFLGAASAKHRDLALAFPHRSFASIEASAAADFAEGAHGHPNDHSPPSGSALCADGRLLELLSNDGGSWLRGHDRLGLFEWPVLIGEADGQWAVYR